MPPTRPTRARLEALSDGVIAVILTIMVLELKVPLAGGFAGFVTVLPAVAVYALSFAFTGVYWVNHGHLVDRLEHVDHLVLWTNLVFLFLLSLLPFCTEYVSQKHLDSFSVELYAASLLVTACGFQALGAAVLRHACQTQRPSEAEHQDHLWEIRKGWFSSALYVLALLLARWRPGVAMFLLAGATLVWIVPTFGRHPLQSVRTKAETSTHA